MPATPVQATRDTSATPWQVPLSPAMRRHLARLLVGVAADIEDDHVADAGRPTPPSSGVPSPTDALSADPLHGLAGDSPAVAGESGIGLRHVVLQGFPWPLWLRAGTHDTEDLHRTITTLTEALPLPFAPRRILDLGAGFGYRAVALARAYPDASIVAVEALPRAWRLLSLNTLPWRQISPMRLAVAAADATCTIAIGADGLRSVRTEGCG